MKKTFLIICIFVFFAFWLIGCTAQKSDENTDRIDYFLFTDYSTEIKTDGSADVSVLLQKCIDEHDNVLIPSGNYLVSNTVTLHSGCNIKGEGNDTVFIIEDNDLFTADGIAKTETTEGKFIENLSFSSFKVKNESKGHVAVSACSFDGIIIDAVNTEKVCIVAVYSFFNGEKYGFCTSGFDGDPNCEWSKNLTVKNCKADGTEVDEESCGVFLNYINGFTVENCSFSNMGNGVQGYGGDQFADPSGENMRVCNGSVKDCTFINMRWGATVFFLSDNITVTGCKADYCADVGIDFETCDNCLAENNRVSFCGNNFGIAGCAPGSITVRNNFSFQDADGQHCGAVSVNDKTHASDNGHILLDGNQFISVGEISYINIVYYTSPSLNEITVKNNTFKNVILTSSLIKYDNYSEAADNRFDSDLRNVTVCNNTFTFDAEQSKYMNTAVYLPVMQDKGGKSPAVVFTGNKITIKKDSVIVSGVSIENMSEKAAIDVIVTDNTIEGGDGTVKFTNIYGGKMNVTAKNNNVETLAYDGEDISFTENGNKNSNGNEIKSTPLE